jgi:hypothetical protein
MHSPVETLNSQFAGYFTEWLVNSIAPTILGSKPSTVLTLANTRIQPLLAMWRTCGASALEETLVCFRILHWAAERETVLFYRSDMLEQCIVSEPHKHFLEQHGYPVKDGLDTCLEMLQRRYQHCCPHEVGILLGIPFKDVLGFMGLADLPLTCRGEWCVYGNAEESLAIMNQYAADRVHICRLLAQGFTPGQILAGEWGELRCAI